MKVSATLVGDVLTGAVVASLDRMAITLELDPLNWTLVPYPDGMVVEGRPRRRASSELCRNWADALGMIEYHNGPTDARSWYLADRPWQVEIIDQFEEP